MKKIILASSSPYRKEQLKRLNIDFETVPSHVDESVLKENAMDHEKLSVNLALAKVRSVSSESKRCIVIGGDQIASFSNNILSKPKTKEKAFYQLKALSGNKHQLITSLVIVADELEYIHTTIATMKMRNLSDEQIHRYIEKDRPLDCCGSYRLESMGISLFAKIHCDDYTSIIGMGMT